MVNFYIVCVFSVIFSAIYSQVSNNRNPLAKKTFDMAIKGVTYNSNDRDSGRLMRRENKTITQKRLDKIG